MAKKAAKKDSLIVGSKVKAYIKKKGAMTSGELLEAVNKSVYCLLDCAVARTKANGRKTVRAQDV